MHGCLLTASARVVCSISMKISLADMDGAERKCGMVDTKGYDNISALYL